jgi:hypothetical protein
LEEEIKQTPPPETEPTNEEAQDIKVEEIENEP